MQRKRKSLLLQRSGIFLGLPPMNTSERPTPQLDFEMHGFSTSYLVLGLT